MSGRRHKPVFPGFKEMTGTAGAAAPVGGPRGHGGAGALEDGEGEASLAARRALSTALSAKRSELGLSQTEVAARMGTSQSAVARLESGQADLRLSTLERYAAALGQQLDIKLSLRPQGDPRA